MQTGLLPAGVTPEIITLSGGWANVIATSPPTRSVLPILARAGNGAA